MSTGLIIGKFMPLHQGHIALINFAAERCDKLIVLVCALPGEPIPGSQRLSWVQQTFRNNRSVIVEYTDEALPAAQESCRIVSGRWAAYLSGRFPGVDMIFSSEPYGDFLAEFMHIRHCVFDLQRQRIPVSATEIRTAPFKHWQYIPQAVRPWYRKKICLYGPESTGKSTLTRLLAGYFKTACVPEIARELLGERRVVYEDIAVIAEKHARALLEQEERAEQLLFCDTDLITTCIYSSHYFNKVPEFPAWIKAVHHYDLYLFCDIDVPWVPDPQRDLGHMRKYFRERFLRELEQKQLPYMIINGSWQERFSLAVDTIKSRWEFKLDYVMKYPQESVT